MHYHLEAMRKEVHGKELTTKEKGAAALSLTFSVFGILMKLHLIEDFRAARREYYESTYKEDAEKDDKPLHAADKWQAWLERLFLLSFAMMEVALAFYASCFTPEHYSTAGTVVEEGKCTDDVTASPWLWVAILMTLAAFLSKRFNRQSEKHYKKVLENAHEERNRIKLNIIHTKLKEQPQKFSEVVQKYGLKRLKKYGIDKNVFMGVKYWDAERVVEWIQNDPTLKGHDWDDVIQEVIENDLDGETMCDDDFDLITGEDGCFFVDSDNSDEIDEVRETIFVDALKRMIEDPLCITFPSDQGMFDDSSSSDSDKEAAVTECCRSKPQAKKKKVEGDANANVEEKIELKKASRREDDPEDLGTAI